MSPPRRELAEQEWHGVPEVRWDAFATFAAANQLSTGAGKALIRDALVLSHRLPRVWARIVADRDQEIGLVGLDRVIDEAITAVPAALCRHDHRLKTHAGRHYTTIEPGVYLWSDPYRHQYIHTRDGTHEADTLTRTELTRTA